MSYMATADINGDGDNIHLRTELSYRYSKGGCIDIENGYIYWTTMTIGQCSHDRFIVLYEGVAQKVQTSHVNGANSTVYIASTRDK